MTGAASPARESSAAQTRPALISIRDLWKQLGEQQVLKGFDLDGYQYVPQDSDAERWMFRRRLAE